MAKQQSTKVVVQSPINTNSDTTDVTETVDHADSQDQDSTDITDVTETVDHTDSQDQDSTEEIEFIVVKGFGNLEGSFNVGDKYNGSLKSAKSLLRNGLIKIVK